MRRTPQDWVFLVAAIVLVGSWGTRIWLIYARNGLFTWLGVDYGYYYALVQALWASNGPDIYDRARLDAFHQLLTSYATGVVPGGLTPYPPLFAWLFSPFVMVPPPVGFATWTLVNLGVGAYLGWRAAYAFPAKSRRWVMLFVVTSLPFGFDLLVGQAMLPIAVAFAEFYLSARAGRDVRAGLWLALTLVKPQYLLVLVPLLFWKRRWAILIPVAAGGLVLVLGSVLVAGGPAVLAYLGAVLEEGAGFDGALSQAHPEAMVNWRALVLAFPIGADERLGLAITAWLSVLTVICTARAWRGPWAPSSPMFPARILLALIATLLASYHSHLPGALLMATPAAAVLVADAVQPGARAFIMAAVALTTLQFTLRGNPSFGSIGVILALALSFIGLLYFLRTSQAQAEVGEAHGVFWRLSPALEAERAQD